MRRREAVITVDEVADLIRRELRGKLSTETVLGEATELEDLGLSSLQVSEIVFTLEENHEVEFDAARAADARTLGDVVALANEALAADGTAGQVQSARG
jgi:acyl carrier protein